MTPEEKWVHLVNPQTVKDYGLSLTEAELATFPEGRVVLTFLHEDALNVLDDNTRVAIAERMGETLDQLIYTILTRGRYEL